MITRQLVLPGEIVKKSNALLRARWSPESIWEPRLVALLASKVRKDDQDFQIYEICVSELLGAKYGGRDVKEIAAVVDRVMSRVLTIKDDKGWTKYNVFVRCRFRSDEGILELGFHPDLKPHYLGLQEFFATYNLMEFMLLPSTYSQRLFEILKSWSDKPEAVIDLADLFAMLDVPETLRRYPDFRRYVLEKAHKDISGKTSLRFEWEPIKRGRAVAAIRFVFSAVRSVTVKRTQKAQDSARDSAILRKAVACFKSGSCTPKKSRQCELCQRLVKKGDD